MGCAMKLAMSLAAAVIAIAGSVPAHAAVWAWGCQGQMGGQQLIFNRYSMFIVDGKKPFTSVHKLTNEKIDDLIKGDSVSYEANNGNDGFARTIEATRSDNEKSRLTLTELSSKKISGTHRLICGRDEDTDIYRKVYRVQRDDEPAREITMQCIEYQLSTRGGRPGCD